MKANLSSSVARDYNRNIGRIFAFRFFRNLHFFSAVMVPFFTVWGQISFTEVMILQAIFTFSIFLLEVPTGVIADYFGRKASLILGGIVGFIAPLVYVIIPNFWVFAFAEFLWAVAAALVSGADSALVYDSLRLSGEEKKSKKVFARYGSLGLLGILVATPIGGLIAQFFGVRATMFLTAVPMGIAVLIALTFKEPKIHFESKEVKQVDSPGEIARKKGYFETFKDGFLHIAKHKQLRELIFDYVPTAVLAFFMIWVYQVVLDSYGVAIGWFGFVHAGIVIAEILLLHFFTNIENWFGGKRKYLKVSAFVVGGLFLVLAFVRNLYVAIFCFLVIGALGLTRKNIYTNYLNKFIESHNRATVLSTVSMIYSLAMAVNNVILGRLIDYNLTLGLAVVGVAIILFNLFSRIDDRHLID